MNTVPEISKEEGYTLLETLVAMALFMSVLIPLGVTLGNFLLDDKADMTGFALQAAQSEMSRMATVGDFTPVELNIDHGLFIKKTVEQHDRIMEVNINVYRQKYRTRVIVNLRQSFLKK